MHGIALVVVPVEKISLSFGYTYIKSRDFKFIPDKYFPKLEGYSVGVRANWHFDNVNSDGFYLGAGASYGSIRTYDKKTPLKYKESIILAVVPGYSRRWDSGLQLRTGLAVSYDTTASKIGAGPELELTWYFN